MTCYLLAAEADKIQDLIFRSARLREVVGASQLLTRFCREAPAELVRHLGGNFETDKIICDGGSFRILFDQKEKALEFGEYLSEAYRVATGGSLTVAEPVKIEEPVASNFSTASEEAELNLRQAKRKNKSWCGEEQMPYMAICTSCGTGLAKSYSQDEGKHVYLCSSCLNKGAESKQGENAEFLQRFYKIIAEKDNIPLNQYSWPGQGKKDPTEEMAAYDSNRYVAYLLADGNGMGKVFGKCQEQKKMIALSNKLSLALCCSLAKPTRRIMKNNQLDNHSNFIPVLPLILGGDDLFALLPAPWALDFALSFCQKFEQEMNQIYKEIEFDDVPAPTISATVVICKNNHPYTLAYETAAAGLKKAKQLYRKKVLYEDKHCSVINFEVVVGGQLTASFQGGDFRPTLKPYFLEGSALEGWGLPLKRLVEQRWNLRSIPSRRLHELQNFYDPANDQLFPMQIGDMESWKGRLNRLLKRIKLRSEKQNTEIHQALTKLGGIDDWYQVERGFEDIWYGHGLPDLLDAWDYVMDLDKPIRDYEEG